MKKFITAAAFAATLGAASSVGFAAANPFEDVPADHWANDAIRQLVADGVIEGYGDGTYRGDQEITRYEVAQIVAKAMAKQNVSAADKAAIDKLAAEFSDELNSLGVRVSALEKKVDNVKFNGFLGYHYWNNRVSGMNSFDNRINQYEFQLNVKAQVNKNWQVRSRLKFNYESDNAKNASNSTTCLVDRAWAIGQYGKTKIELGKLYYETMQDNGMVLGNRISGVAVTTGNKLQVKLAAGRINTRPNDTPWNGDSTANVQSIELNYKASKAVSYGAAFFHLTNGGYETNACRFQPCLTATPNNLYGSDKRNIWEIGGHWKFAPKWDLNLAYAKNQSGNWENKYQQAYNIEFTYNGGRYPDFNKPGNLGAFVAYRYLGRGALIYPVYDGIYQNGRGTEKGFEVGACYVFEKNLTGTVLYFRGKEVIDGGNRDSSTLYTLLQAWF